MVWLYMMLMIIFSWYVIVCIFDGGNWRLEVEMKIKVLPFEEAKEKCKGRFFATENEIFGISKNVYKKMENKTFNQFQVREAFIQIHGWDFPECCCEVV